MRRLAALIVPLCMLLATAAPRAADESSAAPIWATVNFCDSVAAPSSMGVRVNMPGIDEADTMRVRFLAQYWAQGRQDWLTVNGASSSGWIDVGSTEYSYGQAGYTYRFDPPQPGKNFMVRAIAELQWLREGKVVRSAQRVVRGGVGGVDVGETSRGSCLIQ